MSSLSSLIPDQPLKSTVTILMIDHSEQDRCTYADYLQADETTQYHLLMADSLEAGQAIWRLQQPDVVLVNVDLPDGNGLFFLEMMAPESFIQKLPVIVLMEQRNEQTIIQAMKLGAMDYLIKEEITAFFLCHSVNRLVYRYELERENRKLTDRLELALKSSHIGIWDWNIDTNELIWDKSNCELYGIFPADFQGYKTWEKRVHPEDLPLINQAVQKSLTGDQELVVEFRVIWPNKTVRYLKGYALVQRNAEGDPQRMIGTNFDITDIKQAEEDLRRSEKIFRQLFEEIPIGIAMVEANIERFYQVNRTLCEMLGYSHQELLQLNFNEITHPEDLALEAPLAAQAIAGEITSYQIEKRYRKKNGEYFWGQLKTTTIRGTKGELLYGIGMVEDITNRKQVEIKMQVSLEQEKKLNNLRSHFITMASHEFRTPLTIIYSATALVKKYSDRLTAEKKEKHLTNIIKTVQYMTKILDDMLMINSVDNEKIQFTPEPTDVIGFCENLKQSLETKGHHHIHFSWQLEQSTQHPSTRLIASFDPYLLRQTLENILSNAIKYSPQQNSVEFYFTQEPNYLIFQISDRGIGIPEEDWEDLFQPFHRGSNVGNITGVGLGLVIIQRCLSLHGGQLNFKSQIGEGTTVTVRIPQERIS